MIAFKQQNKNPYILPSWGSSSLPYEKINISSEWQQYNSIKKKTKTPSVEKKKKKDI